MKTLLCVLLIFLPGIGLAQSRTVAPEDLTIRVEVENAAETRQEREMILIRILGTYRRHITLESLQQPDLAGFNWSQLGPDRWWQERVDGRPVKRFERRMALYPDRPGTLTIGAFVHNLTLTDEGDDWFEHPIRSEPISIDVAPAPQGSEWWFPVRRLRVSDEWSNPPDQLVPGEGVLRIVRIEALGATPEMIPPMPELTSPSAMIFAHPEKRLVELSPEGPMTIAFWRWTIRPTNDTSAIVEPIRFSYFDTTERQQREVVISAQRIAYNDGSTPQARANTHQRATPARLPGWGLLCLGVLVLAAGVGHGIRGRHLEGARALGRFAPFDPLRWRLRRAARAGDPHAMRRAAADLMKRDGANRARQDHLARLDRHIFAPAEALLDLPALAREFCSNALRGHTGR